MDKFGAIHAFIKVVEEGSFAAAARSLNQSRSQVNRSVINLEDDLGAQLFHRTTRKVTLTPTGESFYQRSQQIMNDLRQAEDEAKAHRGSPKGVLRINAPLSFGMLHLSSAVADFALEYPEIKLIVTLNDRYIDPLEEGFDVTVRISPRQEQSALVDHEIIQINRTICAAPEYLERRGAPKQIDDLKEHACLFYGTYNQGNSWRLTGPEGEKSVRVSGPIYSNNSGVLLEAALKGLGITSLPIFCITDELRSGKLVRVLPDHKMLPTYLTILYPPFRHHSGPLRAFIDFMFDRFGADPEWNMM